LVAGAGVAVTYFALTKRVRGNPALTVGVLPATVNVQYFGGRFANQSHDVIVLRAHVNPAVSVANSRGPGYESLHSAICSRKSNRPAVADRMHRHCFGMPASRNAIDAQAGAASSLPKSRRSCRESRRESQTGAMPFTFSRVICLAGCNSNAIITIKCEPVLGLFICVLDSRGGRILRRSYAGRAPIPGAAEAIQPRRLANMFKIVFARNSFSSLRSSF